VRRLVPSHLLVLIALAALPATSHAATTRADYVAQADPYCAAANRDIHRLNKRFFALHKQGRYRAAGRFLGKTGKRLSSSIDQVRAVPPPPGDEQTVASWLGLIGEVASDNRKMGKAEAREQFNKVVKLLRRNVGLHNQAHALVADWGFSSCA
jgi:hypothetical protein